MAPLDLPPEAIVSWLIYILRRLNKSLQKTNITEQQRVIF